MQTGFILARYLAGSRWGVPGVVSDVRPERIQNLRQRADVLIPLILDFGEQTTIPARSARFFSTGLLNQD